MNKFLLLFLLLFLNCTFCSADIITDEIADTLPRAVKQPVVAENYNYDEEIAYNQVMEIIK